MQIAMSSECEALACHAESIAESVSESWGASLEGECVVCVCVCVCVCVRVCVCVCVCALEACGGPPRFKRLLSNEVCEKRVVYGMFPWKRIKPEFRPYLKNNHTQEPTRGERITPRFFTEIGGKSSEKRVFKKQTKFGKKN